MSERPRVHFNLFELGGEAGKFVPERVTGMFRLAGKEIELTIPVPPARAGEKATETYRRELVVIRDALSDMIARSDGILDLRVVGSEGAIRWLNASYNFHRGERFSVQTNRGKVTGTVKRIETGRLVVQLDPEFASLLKVQLKLSNVRPIAHPST